MGNAATDSVQFQKKRNQWTTPQEVNVLFAEKTTINGATCNKPAKFVSNEIIKNNLLGMLDVGTKRIEKESFSGDKYISSESLFVDEGVTINCSRMVVSNDLISQNDITINAREVVIENGASLVSVGGTITINCGNLKVDGYVSADKKVIVRATKVIVNDLISAGIIEINTAQFQSDGDIDDKVLVGNQNRVGELTLFEENSEYFLCGSSNFEYSKLELYGRRSGEDTFSLLKNVVIDNNCSGDENPYNICEVALDSGWNYTDYAAIYIDQFGYSFKGIPLTLVVEDGKIGSTLGIDSDGDCVTDASEIWLSETDPLIQNSFPDSRFFVYLPEGEGMRCYDCLLERDVEYSTEDYTKYYTYNDKSHPRRVSEVKVVYADRTMKNIRFEYEDEKLVNLCVGNNTYTIKDDDNYRRYYINGLLVKEITKDDCSTIFNYFDGQNEIFTYDNDYNLVSYQNGSLFEFKYDDLDLMVGLSKNGARIADFAYDDYGNYTAIEANDYSIHYNLDYPDYIAEYSYGDAQKVQHVYCKDAGYSYGDIIILTDGSDGTRVGNELVGEVVSFDSERRVLQYRIGNENHAVQFNAKGYVISETIIGCNESTDGKCVIEYSYDDYGNILSVVERRGEKELAHTYAYSTLWSDQLISFDGAPISYDSHGKPIYYYNGSQLAWSAGKLASISNEEVEVSYEYSYNGLREKKTVNGSSVKYIYEGNDLIAEIGTDTVYYTFDGNFDLIGFEWNGKAYYYQFNVFGDVIAILDKDGIQVCSYSYDSWGLLKSISGDSAIANRNPIRYRGYYYDCESGLYYLRNRYYDPTIKRFLTFDDLESFFYGEEENIDGLFVYCSNNPVLFCDYEGQYLYSNTVLCNKQWWDSESTQIINDINAFIKKQRPNDSSLTGRYMIEEKKDFSKAEADFISKWNSMSLTQFAVVIDSHGEPDGLLWCDDYYGYYFCKIDTVRNKLKYVDISVIVLLGCNCGHVDYKDSNIARAFADRFRTVVIASDGSVNCGEFRSVVSKRWRQLNKKYRAENAGWVFYVGKSLSNNYQGKFIVYGGKNLGKVSQLIDAYGFLKK